MKRLILPTVLLATCGLRAEVDSVTLTGWSGTAYHGDWFAFALPEPYADSGAVKLDGAGEFVLTPTYPGAVRKVVLNVYNSSSSPIRGLAVSPLVKGVETENADLVRVFEKPTKAERFEYVHFDWPSSESVTALRLHLTSGTSGNWGVSEMHVFYGDRTADEDAVLGRLLNTLPPPPDVAVVDITSNSLTAAAGTVAQAEGYRFALCRLDGLPRTECREDFAFAPECSPGWTMTCSGVAVANNASYADKKMYPETGALEIDKPSTDGAVGVEIVSPLVDAAITECSFMCRIGKKGKSDRFAVCGRPTVTGEWKIVAADITPTSEGSNKYFSYELAPSNDIRQLKFAFTAQGNDFTKAGLDSLCLVYGGDEQRTLVAESPLLASPTNVFAELSPGRYVVKAQAVPSAGLDLGASPWSEETEAVDLSWADLELLPPGNVTTEVSGDKLTVSWEPVDGAVCYLLDVVSEEDPDAPVVAGWEVRGCRETVVVPAVGAYAVRVTAVSPCGKSVARSEAVTAAVPLGKMGTVKASAVDKETILATWSEIPLAESYQARLMRVGGDVTTDRPDFSGLPDVWPAGWSHYSFDDSKYAGPVPKMQYTASWIETCAYARPVTEVVCKFKSHVTAEAFAEDVSMTAVVVSGSSATDGDAWTVLAELPVSSFLQTVATAVPASADVRRLRFAIDYRGSNPKYWTAVNLEFNVLSVTTGEQVLTEVRDVGVRNGAVTFAGLDPTARYQVVVTAQPSPDAANSAASGLVDLATEKFRTTGVIPVSGLKNGTYAMDFCSLSNVTSSVDSKRVDLDYWQFNKGSGEAEKIMSQVGTNKVTSGGIYACRDRADPTDDMMLGLLATGTTESSFGLAFLNDTDRALRLEELSFAWVQRSFRPRISTNCVEWLVTDGVSHIGAEGDWTAVASTRNVSSSDAPESGEAVRRTVGLSEDDCPQVPVGGVLILRWRQDKMTSGPLMAIDDLTVRFPSERPGACMILR